MVGKSADECAVGKKTFTHHKTKGPQTNLRGAVGMMVRPGDETVCVHVHLKQCFIALRCARPRARNSPVFVASSCVLIFFFKSARELCSVGVSVGAFVHV